MDETGGVSRPSPIEHKFQEIGAFAKKHWVEISLGVMAVALFTIGMLTHTHVIVPEVGSLSPQALEFIVFGGAAAATIGLLKLALTHIRDDIRRKKAERVKEPSKEEEEGPSVASWSIPTNGNVERQLRILGREVTKIRETKGDIAAIEKLTSELQQLPQTSCVVFRIADTFVFRGKAIRFDTTADNVLPTDTYYATNDVLILKIKPTDMSPLYFGIDYVDKLEGREMEVLTIWGNENLKPEAKIEKTDSLFTGSTKSRIDISTEAFCQSSDFVVFFK